MPYTTTGANPSYLRLWAEVYNATDLGVNETPVVTTLVPNEDIALSQVMYSSVAGPESGPTSSTATNLDQYVDDTTDELISSYDYISLATGSYARFAFNGSTLPAGRVLSVTVEVRYQNEGAAAGSQGGGGLTPLSVQMYNGTSFVATLGTITPSATNQNPYMANATVGPFYTNPLTNEPWMRDDIVNMDTGSNLLIQLTGASGLMGLNNTKIAALRVKVSMITEKRVAVGANGYSTAVFASTLIYTGPGSFCSLKTPSGTDNWAKAASTDYIVVIRRILNEWAGMAFQTPRFRYVGVTCPHDQGTRVFMSVDSLTGRITSTASVVDSNTWGLLLARSDSALSVDSQVYHIGSSPEQGPTASKQFMSNAASTNYLIVRALVGIHTTVINGLTAPNQPLLFKVKRASDNVQMGGTATLNAADIGQHVFLGYSGDPLKAWYDVQLALSSAATLVSGTQYYVEFSSTAASPYWVLKRLDYTETHSYTGDQSYGGSVDYGDWLASGPVQQDFVVTLTTAPPTAPATITVTKTALSLPDPGDPSCTVGTHEYAHVVWAPTADGEFDRYELQRSEDGGTTWQLIARITPEATVSFDDHEAARGVALQYRIRMVRGNGNATAWRTQSGTITLAYNSGAIIFATNTDTALTVGYLTLGTVHDYRFLSDAEVSIVQMHERDYQTQFRPLEDRGVGYSWSLLIHSRSDDDRTSVPAGGVGAAAFDPLRAVVEAPDATYTTIFTPDGVRLFGAVRLPTGRRYQPAEHYTAPVSIVEVAATPAVVDV